MFVLDKILQECKEEGREPVFLIDQLTYGLSLSPARWGDLAMDARDGLIGCVEHVSPEGYTALKEDYVCDLVPTEYVRRLEIVVLPTIANRN